MNHRKIGIAALMLLGVLPVAAIAETVPQQPAAGSATSKPADPGAQTQAQPSMFQQLDTNHDGYIESTEAKRSATVSATFDKVDTNHDGRISAQEYEKGAMN
jgi:hypothetical protein